MKKSLFYALIITFLLSSCGYIRIGDLNMVSNRNIDSGKEYVLIERNVESVVKTKKEDALERAIDAVTEEHEGEYLMNVKIFVKGNGKKIKVIGDVWGVKSVAVNVETTVTKSIELKTGDAVTFKVTGKLVEGSIIGINANGAIVEYPNLLGKTVKKEIPFDELTKIEK